MNLLVALLLVILLCGGWAYAGYLGGPYLGSGLRLVLIVLLVLALYGRL